MSDFWTLNPRSTQILLTYQYKSFNIYKIHHSESTPSVSMSIEHHHSVLFTIHEQSVTVRLDWEITLSAWLSFRFVCLNPPPAYPLHYPGSELRFMQPVPAPSEARPLRTSPVLPPQLHAGPSTGRYMPYPCMAFLHIK
jgi:hypothetical protein